jgi:hypothetical protein
MRVAQLSWSETTGWVPVPDRRSDSNLVFFFGPRRTLPRGARYNELRAMFPAAHILGRRTGEQIRNEDGVCECHNQTMTVTTIAATMDGARA